MAIPARLTNKRRGRLVGASVKVVSGKNVCLLGGRVRVSSLGEGVAIAFVQSMLISEKAAKVREGDEDIEKTRMRLPFMKLRLKSFLLLN